MNILLTWFRIQPCKCIFNQFSLNWFGMCVNGTIIIESVDSISRDGMDTSIYIIHYKHPNISEQITL